MNLTIKILNKADKPRPWDIYQATLTLPSGATFTAESICPNAAENKVFYLARKAKAAKK